MIEDELVEKFKDHNLFIGDIIRAPKVKKVSKGEHVILLTLFLVIIKAFERKFEI